MCVCVFYRVEIALDIHNIVNIVIKQLFEMYLYMEYTVPACFVNAV